MATYELITNIRGLGFHAGNGSPEGVVQAPKSDMYLQRDSVTTTGALWIKASGSGNTGWVIYSEAPAVDLAAEIQARIDGDQALQDQFDDLTAASVGFVPSGSISATDTQSAIAELDTETQAQFAALPATYASEVAHGSTAGTARPSTSLAVLWVGTVTPTNATNGDRWLNPSTGDEKVKVSGSFVALNADTFSPLIGRGLDAVFLGDSHTVTGCIPNPADTGSIALSSGGFVPQLLARSGKLRYKYNAGISGNTTAQMLARWDTDVAPYNPTFLHILGGTNDAAGGVVETTTIGNLRTMIRKGKKLGALVCIGTIPPRSSDDLALDNIERLNVGIKALAATEGAILVDYHSVLVDPADGHYASGMSTDGTHPNAAGAKAMAKEFVRVVNPLLPYSALPVAMSQAATTPNRCANSCMLTDSNADGIPDGFSTGGSASSSTKTLVTDSDFLGKAFQVDFTTASNLSFTQSVTNTKWAIGQRVAFCGKFKASVEAGSGKFDINLRFNNAAGNMTKLSPVNQWTIDTDGIAWYYIEGVIPPSTNLIYLQLTCVSGTGQVKIGQMAMWVLDEIAS